MDIQQFIEIRRTVLFDEVSLGYETIRIIPVDDLIDEQEGYSITPSGEDLTGDGLGDWRSSWLVIGRDESVGDPIFVDLAANDLPVYKAAHGEGEWNPVLVSSTFIGFIQALEELDRIAHGRRNPVELERNPISEADRIKCLNRISEICGDISLDFWEPFFDE